MRYVKLFLRILRYTVYAAFAFAIGAIAVLTLTERGRDNLAGLISGFSSSPGQTVKIAGIDGIWSGNLRLASLVLEDEDGPWLVARNVAVDWSPLRLFSRTFEAERISAERIEVARRPKPASKPKEAAGSFSLPVSIDVKQIDLPDIALGPALAGGVASVAARGSARAEASPLQIVSQLNIARSDGRAGNIDATIDFAPADNRIDLDIRALEPQGGIIANLLRLPGEPAVGIDVSGSGPAANWSGSGTFAVDGSVITRVDARHQFTDRGSAIEVKGDGDFERFMPEDLRPLLAGNSNFDFAGTLTRAGGVDIERATIESDAIRGTASGTLDPAGASDFALQVDAAGDGVPLSFGTEDAPIDMVVQSASFRAIGDGREPNLDIVASLSKVETPDAKLDNLAIALHSDAFNIKDRTGPVTGTAAADALIIDNATIAPLVAGKIKAGLAGTLATDSLTVTDGNLGSDAVAGKFTGDVSLVDGSVTLKIDADVASSALPASVRPVLAEYVELAAEITRDHEGHVSADPFSISSGAFTVSGSVQAANEEIDATVSGKLGDVGLLAQDATGAIDISATAQGALAKPDVSLTVTSDRIEAAGREIAGLKLVATGKADAANPAADVSLTGTVGGEVLDGRARLSTSSGKREIKGLTLSLGQNRIVGDLVLDERFLPLGTVNFQLPDVGALAALALETVRGDLNGTISFTDNAGKPELTVNATTKSLARGDVTAGNVAIDATVADFAAAPAVSGRVRAATVTSGKTVVRAIDVRLTQQGGWTGFDGGATVSDIPARAIGRVQVANGRTVVELASGQATVRGLETRLARASRVEIAGGTTTLDQVALDIGGGNVVVSGTAGSTLNLNATLSAVPASVANNFSPGLDAAGTLSGTARVTGAAASPAVNYSIDWRGAQTAQTRSAGLSPLSVTSSGDFAGGRLNFQANAGGSGLGLRGGGTVDTGSRALSLDFSGGVPFSFLAPRLAASGLALTGSSNVNLQVRGTTNSPAISGSLSTSGARFVAAASGIAINDIRADIAMANGVATIRTLTGNLSTGGSISGSGTIGMAAGSGFPADIRLRIANGRYTDGHVVTTTMNGDLAIRGPIASKPTLSGTVNLGRTVITVPDRLPGSLASLDVQHRNAPAAVKAQARALAPPSASGGGSGALTLDLAVNANNQIFVTGRGLDAELGGTLRLTGSTASPEAVGQFTLRRGRLAILGRRLTFTRGTISFAGSLVPNLDLAADSNAGNTRITVSVSGPANNPRFNFTSVPSLPEDEVLARLIFGRSMSNLSPLQIAQLADAAASLAGGGGSSSMLQSLRSKIGVDDLDVRTNDDGSTSVAAGKYLNDRTYLSLEKGDKAGSGKARIDLDIGRGVKLRGEANDAGEAKGGIFFEREY